LDLNLAPTTAKESPQATLQMRSSSTPGRTWTIRRSTPPG
jgi:hypothetical protein